MHTWYNGFNRKLDARFTKNNSLGGSSSVRANPDIAADKLTELIIGGGKVGFSLLNFSRGFIFWGIICG